MPCLFRIGATYKIAAYSHLTPAQFERLPPKSREGLMEWEGVDGAASYFKQSPRKRSEICRAWRYWVCQAVDWDLPLHRTLARLPISAGKRQQWSQKALPGGLSLPPLVPSSPATDSAIDAGSDAGIADTSDGLSELVKPAAAALRRSPRGRSTAPPPQPKIEEPKIEAEDQDSKPSRAQLASAVRPARHRAARPLARVKREDDETKALSQDGHDHRRSKRARVKRASDRRVCLADWPVED